MNSTNQQGMNALMWAAQRGYSDIVGLLLQVPGVSVEASNRWGFTVEKSTHPEIQQLVSQHKLRLQAEAKANAPKGKPPPPRGKPPPPQRRPPQAQRPDARMRKATKASAEKYRR